MQCYVTYFHIGPGNAVALTHEKKSKRQNDKKTIKKNVKQKKRQKEPLIIKPPSIFPCGSVLGHGRWVSRCSQNFSFTLNQSPRYRELFFEETNFFRIHSNRILYLPPIPPLTLYFAATLHIVQSISISDRQHKDRCPHISVCRGLGLLLHTLPYWDAKTL